MREIKGQIVRKLKNAARRFLSRYQHIEQRIMSTKKDGYEKKKALVSQAFDHEFYLFHNPDVAEAGVDPVDHYFDYGWEEGRNPHPEFSTREYLDRSPDVRAAGVNPYWHYLIAGKREARVAMHPGGNSAEVLENLQPLEAQVGNWKNQNRPDTQINLNNLLGEFQELSAEGMNRLVISITHDHYRKIPGGVQLCVQREEQTAREAGLAYLNIHPWQPLPRLAHEDEDPDPLQMLVLNGKDIGFCPISTLSELMIRKIMKKIGIQVVIHSLLGHHPERISQLVKKAGKGECWLWLHDYFTICPSYTLQRNTISFCGAPGKESTACGICCFGPERLEHSQRMQDFFGYLKVHVISPSKVTKDFWLEKANLKHSSISVSPHVRLRWLKRKNSPLEVSERPIKVAFLGMAMPHKGWNEFQNLFNAHRSGGQYQFHYFGTDNVHAGFEQKNIHVTLDKHTAMTDAIAEAEIDLVLHWASWPETFSLSSFEALAGGAFVITNSGSGNVAAAVKRQKRGVVLNDEAELQEFFNSSQARELTEECRDLRQRTQARYSLSRMSLPFLEKAAN